MSKGKKPNDGPKGGKSPNDPPFKGVGSSIKHSIGELMDVVIATALQIPDPEDARTRLRAMVTAAFFAIYGAVMGRLDEQIAHLEEKYQAAKAELLELRKQLAATPEWVPSARENQDLDIKDHVQVPLRKWQLRHQIGAFALSVLLVGALAASMITAHYNLKGTELPVFTENELLVWSMAALAPMSAIAIKTMAAQMRRERSRSIFTVALMVGTVLSIVAWVILFSLSYHGLATGLDLGGLLDETSVWKEVRDTAFVAVSLSVEILAGALIAQKIDQIASNYAPNYWNGNLLFESLSQRVHRLEPVVDAMAAELAELKGERLSYTESLNLQIETALLAHDGRRGRPSDTIL